MLFRMEQTKLQEFKTKLLDEKARLEMELATIAKQNPEKPGDWEAVIDESDIEDRADKNDLADSFEDLEENTSITETLEARLSEVVAALARIEDGSYGKDEKTGEDISAERLEANPAARTNI